MKKYITFSNFIAVLGIMTVLFYLIPAIKITSNDQSAIDGSSINLFIATFGGRFTLTFSETMKNTYSLHPCGGLIVAFCLLFIGIILTVLKMKNKFATLLAIPFYIASGSIIICSSALLKSTNIGTVLSPSIKFINLGGMITVAVFCFILSALALVDFVGVIARPKQQTQQTNPAI